MAVDICYLISHGFTTRMLMQTGLLDRLIDRGKTIGIVSPDESDENFSKYLKHPQVQIIQWNSKSSLWDDNYLHKRMYFLENIRTNTALLEKVYNGLFFSDSRHPWKRIRPLYYYLIYLLIPFFPGLRRTFIGNEKKYLSSPEADEILQRLKPKLVVSTYPVSILEAKILNASKLNSIPTLQHLLSWDNVSCKGRFPVVADSFIAWGDIMKEEIQQSYKVPIEKIAVCGVPHFDLHVQTRQQNAHRIHLQQMGLNGDSPYLLLAMSSPRFAPKEIDIVRWLAKEVLANKYGNRMQLVIRPHPQNVSSFMAKGSHLEKLRTITGNRVVVDFPELNQSNIRWSMKEVDMKNLSTLIGGCSILINSGSTVSIDALMHNKPVIITAFDGTSKISYWNSARRLVDYPHLKKFIGEGGAKPVKNYYELEKSVLEYLSSPNHDIKRRRTALYRECYLDDGRSTERVANKLIEQIDRSKRKRSDSY